MYTYIYIDLYIKLSIYKHEFVFYLSMCTHVLSLHRRPILPLCRLYFIKRRLSSLVYTVVAVIRLLLLQDITVISSYKTINLPINAFYRHLKFIHFSHSKFISSHFQTCICSWTWLLIFFSDQIWCKKFPDI